jgi:hypothetical protein
MDLTVPNTDRHGPPPAVGAAAAAQQPKVVQTAFIHKLYKSVYTCTHACTHTHTHVCAPC